MKGDYAMTGPAHNTRLQGSKLALARFVWFILAITSFIVAVAAIPVVLSPKIYTCPADPCYSPALGPVDQAALPGLGLSLDAYTRYFAVVETIPTLLAFLAVGVIIFWRRSDDLMSILTSLFLLTFSMGLSSAHLSDHSLWRIPSFLLISVGSTLLVILFYLFPDGRFAPSWMKWFALAIALHGLAGLYARLFAPGLMENPLLNIIPYFLLLAIAFGSQVYRYLRVSTSLQRQQTKWIVMAAFMMPFSDLFIRSVILPWLFLALTEPGANRVLFNMVTVPIFRAIPFVLVPVSFGVAILRYRLWDIDLIIRRTLTYSCLTAALALVYFSTILLLQGVVNSLPGANTPIITVASTLAVAALFSPLRRQIQNFIDRRFYRQKYNTDKVMAAFSTTLRDEVNLERLTNSILGVVDQTMQPSHLSLWMREPRNEREPD
jgi:hypothetical protein